MTKDLTPEQIQEAENTYKILVDKLARGEPIDEGFWGGLAGGTIGFLAGPAIMKAICHVLGISEDGALGKLLTSRLVMTAVGISVGK